MKALLLGDNCLIWGCGCGVAQLSDGARLLVRVLLGWGDHWLMPGGMLAARMAWQGERGLWDCPTLLQRPVLLCDVETEHVLDIRCVQRDSILRQGTTYLFHITKYHRWFELTGHMWGQETQPPFQPIPWVRQRTGSADSMPTYDLHSKLLRIFDLCRRGGVGASCTPPLRWGGCWCVHASTTSCSTCLLPCPASAGLALGSRGYTNQSRWRL